MMPLAEFDVVGMMALSIPIIAVMIPIVAMLIKHQQQMATIVYGGHQNASNAQELAEMREEMRQLKSQMNALIIERDSLQAKNAPLADRLGESQTQS